MNIELWFAAMWLSEVSYSRIRDGQDSSTVAYLRARGTVMFDRIITGRIPVVRDVQKAPELHLVRK